MRNALKSLALAAALLPGIALAQAPQYPKNLPDRSVVGRLGSGSSSGPSEAIPFSVLSAQLTGASIRLNSGNGQTAPGQMSGGGTYSFGATTDTPRMAGLGLGGAAPATGLEVYNAAVSPTGNGQGVLGASSINGGMLGGQGSTYDAALVNKSLAVVLGVPTGTQNVVLQGTLTAASLSTVGTIAGSLCATSGGVILYEAAVNCFAVSGITVVSGKTLTVDNTIELAGTDGTKFTFPGTSDTVDTLAANQTVSGNKTFSGTLNITGTGQINGTAFGTFATQNYATPPAIGGTTPNSGAFSTLTATTPIGLTSGGTNGSTAAASRAAAGLNVDELTSHGDSNYQIIATDRTVGTSANLTAPRTWTLPAASSINSGQHLYIQDFKGFVSASNTITIPRNGSDTINGGTGSQVINTSNGGFLFISDGVSNWSAQALGAQAVAGVASINGQTGNPSIVAGANITVSTTGGNIQVASATPGAWTNVRISKTAAYAVLSADAGSTIALGGSAFFPLTFNAASGYSATAAFFVINEDASFGKLIVPQLATSATSFTIGTGSKAFTTTAGLPISVYSALSSSQRYRVYSLANPANFMSGTVTAYATTTLTINIDTVGGSGTFTDWQIAPEIRLWPGQTQIIYAQNNVWQIGYQGQRWKLPTETEICVDAVSGSDSNDGLGVGTRCFQHIQFAANVVYQDWDANNFPPDIGLYTGPFSESVGIQGQLTGYNFLRFRTRAANTWTNTARCIAVSDGAEAIFDAIFGFTQTWTCNTANAANTGAIYSHQSSIIDMTGAHNWIPGGTNDSFFFFDSDGHATITGSGAGIIIGNGGTKSGAAYVWCDYHCTNVTTGGLLSYSGNVTLALFYVAKGGSVMSHSANPTNSQGTGTIGAASIQGLSILKENGLTPPGGAPSLLNGGIVCSTSC